jgi:electron transfer flavoprotein alpha subunit
MPEQIYVLIDHINGRVRTPSWETVALAQKMAEEIGGAVHALVFGGEHQEVLDRLAEAQLDSILSVSDPKLAQYDPDVYCDALVRILEEDRPHLLLMSHSYQNIDLAPKLAAKLNKGLVTDCVGFRRDDQGLIFIRQMFRNKLNADIRIHSAHPWIVTVQAAAFDADQLKKGHAEVSPRSVDLSSVQSRRKSLETIEAMKGKVDLTKAEVVIGVGRGIKKADNLAMVRELAEVLGGEIGASRPVVDNEWLERERQIGSSGQNVTPKLYIACGISGAIQHIVGMKNSNCIVAINTDPNAPIFNIANYGVVGDVLEIVPALTRKLKEQREA